MKKSEHRWSGAGYVCADCGCIKDTGTETKHCPSRQADLLDVWTYGAHIGWWLHEKGYDNLDDALAGLGEAIKTELEVDGGCILPSGLTPLGDTKAAQFMRESAGRKGKR